MNRNPRWRENFNKPVVLKCKNDWCDNLVSTTANAKHQGVYCPGCRAEARKLRGWIWDRDIRGPRRREATRRNKMAGS